MAASGFNHRNRSPLLAPLRALRAHYRLLLCGIIGVAVGLILPAAVPPSLLPRDWPPFEFGGVTRGLIGWNVAVLLYLMAAGRMIARATHESIRQRALASDEGRNAVLFLTATATCVAVGAIIAELGQSKALIGEEKAPHIALAVVTVFVSWAFMHLIFALHYAHEFYATPAPPCPAAGPHVFDGLRFPNTPTPQYLDFLYYAYTIGVACQTSDVDVCSRRMRAVTLVHSVVSFFFNTTILALMVNIASQFV